MYDTQQSILDHFVFNDEPIDLGNTLNINNQEITLENDQLEAVKGIIGWLKDTSSTKPQYVRLSGYAGTGKTICIAFLVQNLYKVFPLKPILVCTLTWKASLVLCNRGIKSQSIHSVFYKPVTKNGEVIFERRNVNEIRESYSMIIIDEASMISSDMRTDLEAVGLPVLYVGDAAQLPEINPKVTNGKYFMEDAEFNLTKIRRQALESPIIQLSKDIREGKRIKYGKYGTGVFKISAEDLTDKMILASDQLICGKNATRTKLNKYVRKLKGYNTKMMPMAGESIIGLNNILENGIYNGQIWTVLEDRSDIPLTQSNRTLLSIKEDNTERIPFLQKCWFPDDVKMSNFDSVGQLQRFLKENKIYSVDFAYAITTHKMQGSSAKKPIVFEEKLGNNEFHRKWLYTAVTRAEEKLIIVS